MKNIILQVSDADYSKLERRANDAGFNSIDDLILSYLGLGQDPNIPTLEDLIVTARDLPINSLFQIKELCHNWDHLPSRDQIMLGRKFSSAVKRKLIQEVAFNSRETGKPLQYRRC